MLKRITWVEDTVFSLKLKEDVFSLAQMRKNHIMQFFSIMNHDGKWDGVDLNDIEPLFSIFVAEHRLKSLINEKVDKKIVMPDRRPIPRMMLSFTILDAGVYGADLVELDENYSTLDKTGNERIIKEGLTPESDLDLIYQYELCGMEGDPDKLKKRLLRFFDTGVNWDDSKSFLFKDIPLPLASVARSTE